MVSVAHKIGYALIDMLVRKHPKSLILKKSEIGV